MQAALEVLNCASKQGWCCNPIRGVFEFQAGFNGVFDSCIVQYRLV
jgi:hypothetical protein